MGVIDAILGPIELVVAWIMVAWHSGLTSLGMSPTSGVTWGLSIVGLVVVIRIVLIPLFVKQIKASRGLQLLQPDMKKIQNKYKGKTDQASREAMTREMMALYRQHGTNPLAPCLPILLQSPIFFALFRVLNGIGNDKSVGALNPELVRQAKQATLFGAPLSDTFLKADTVNTQIVTVILIIVMSVTTFITQWQLTRKNMPPAALEGQFAQQQKILLYVLPLVFAVSGVNFPIGVLIYWSTTNLWSMGQQFYMIRRMPAPGSLAEKAMIERRRKRGKLPLMGIGQSDEPVEAEAPEPTVRQQPKRQTKKQRTTKGPAGATPPTQAADAGTAASNGSSGGQPGKPAQPARQQPSKQSAKQGAKPKQGSKKKNAQKRGSQSRRKGGAASSSG